MKEIKLVYIAGAYRARTVFGVIRNILKARSISKKLWTKGIYNICPHMNSALLKCNSDDVFLNGDLEILSRCDAVLVLDNWYNSKGTIAEIREAEKLNIPVFYDIGMLEFGESELLNDKLIGKLHVGMNAIKKKVKGMPTHIYLGTQEAVDLMTELGKERNK